MPHDQERISILLVDDREENLLALHAILDRPQYRIIQVTSGYAALEELQRRDFALILLDVQMPGMDGYETAERIRKIERARTTPVIFVTAIDRGESSIRRASQLGAVDFLYKPLDPGVLLAKVEVFAELFRKTRDLRLATERLQRELEEKTRREERYRRLAEDFEKQARTFDTALSSSPEFHFIFDTEQRFAYVNRPLLDLWGLSLEQAVGKTFEELGYAPELILLHRQQLDEALKGKTVRGESDYTSPEGKTGQYEYVFSPIFDAKGNVQAVSGTGRDVTERKLAEQARLEEQRQAAILEQVRESEKTLDQMFSQSPSFMAYLSVPDYRYLKSNEQHDRLLGRRDILGKTVLDLLPELQAYRIIRILDEVVRTGEPFVGNELPVYLKQGRGGETRQTYLDFVFVPLKNPDGKVYGIAAEGNDVTEKVLSRRAVENERENFRNLFQQTPEMVCILRGPDHVFEFVNEAHIKALGFDATGLAVRVAQPESVEVHGILDEVYRTGKTAQLHEIPVTVTDRLRYFNLTYAARRDEAGEINGIMILGVEVTDQVLAREDLRSSREALKFALTSAGMGAWTIDLRTGEVMFSEETMQIFGFEESVPDLGRAISEAIHPEDRVRAERDLNEALASRRAYQSEYRLQLPGGRIVWILSMGRARYDEHGAPFLLSGVVMDITERKRAEEALRMIKDRFELATEAAGVGVWEWNLVSNRVEYVGSQWKLAGFSSPTSSPELTEIFERILPEDRELISRGLREAIEEKREWAGEYRVVWPDGSVRWLMGKSRTYYDEQGKPLRMLGINIDISDFKGVESALQDAIRARDEFLSIASHELKTPITSLKLQLQMTRRQIRPEEGRMPAPERLAKVLEVSTSQVDRLAALIEDLLDIARISSGKLAFRPEKIDVSGLVKEVLERFSDQLIASNGSFVLDASGPVHTFCDRARIEQVFVNLLTNAIKYGDGKPVKISVQETEGRALIQVQDGGLGIPKEKQRVIFERFERAVSGDDISGLGLGLYISRQIVEAHRGSIQVESEPGQGSTFTVELPVVSEGLTRSSEEAFRAGRQPLQS